MSDKKQDKSMPAQKDEIEKFAAANGYRVIRWYRDDGISGAETVKRAGFQALIHDAQENRDFEVIIAWDQDRFSRFDPMEANYYWYILRQAGVRIVTVATGELDFSDLGGWLAASVTQHGKAPVPAGSRPQRAPRPRRQAHRCARLVGLFSEGNCGAAVLPHDERGEQLGELLALLLKLLSRR
jgi:hypothetical protein